MMKLIVDFLVMTCGGLAITLATILAIFIEGTPIIVKIPGVNIPTAIVLGINSLWGITAVGIWIIDRLNSPKHPSKWEFSVLIKEAFVLFIFPFLTMAFEGIPVIQAMTKLVFGKSIVYQPAPKSRVIESNLN